MTIRYSIVLALAVALVSAPAAGARHGGSNPSREPARVVTADRFDWADAAVGAGVAAGVVIALVALRWR